MAGATSVKRKAFRLTIAKRQAPQQLRWSAAQQETLCQILFLEIGEVDLTLAGLHLIARAFNPDEPFVGATRVVSATFPVPSNTAGSPQTVSCPPGTGLISGGVISDTQGDTWVDAPSGNGWSGAANNVAGINPGEVTVYALCAQGVAAPATSSTSASARAAAAATRKAASQPE